MRKKRNTAWPYWTLRIEQRVAADVVQARVQLETATSRIRDAEDESWNAQRSLAENLTGLKNTRQGPC